MRQIPKMALIKPSFEGTKYLCLDAPDMPTLKLEVVVSDSGVEKRMLEYVMLYYKSENLFWLHNFLFF